MKSFGVANTPTATIDSWIEIAHPERVNELIAIFEREVQPAMRATPGNISACLLRPHDARDAFVACTAWQTQADADSYERSGLAQDNVNKLRHTFAGPPSLLTYDGFGG